MLTLDHRPRHRHHTYKFLPPAHDFQPLPADAVNLDEEPMTDMARLLIAIDKDVEQGTNGLITEVTNWMTGPGGWGLAGELPAELFAAALLILAREAGNEYPEYPRACRKAALRILSESLPRDEFIAWMKDHR